MMCNVFPMVLLVEFLARGWLPLSIGRVMTASITLGMAIDGALHVLAFATPNVMSFVTFSIRLCTKPYSAILSRNAILAESIALAGRSAPARQSPGAWIIMSMDGIGVVLADFRPAYLSEPVGQEKLLEIAVRFAEFVARAEAAREGTSLSEDALRRIRAAWEKYGVSPKHIANRRISVLPDAEVAKDPQNLDFASIPFTRPFAERRGGADVAERLAVFRGHACEALEKLYPTSADAPDEMIHVSTTGYLLPSAAQELISKRSWPRTTVTHCYHHGCYGAFPAVRMAAGSLATARGGPRRAPRRVDIVHTEICSIHAAPECVDAEHIICDSLFGDAFIRYSAYDENDFRDRGIPGLQVVHYADTTIPASLEAMSWRPIANRFEMTLTADVPRLIAAHIEEFLSCLLRDAGMDLDADKGHILWVIHPGGPAIVELVGGCLRLSKDQIASGKEVLRDGGNTSSATVPRIWNRILRDPAVEKGTPVVSMAFGPGLTATAMLARVV